MPSPDGNSRGMARGTVLITGGAGFVGSHVADELLQHGYRVRVLDNLDPQVHGAEREWPDYLDPAVECLRGDVRDADAVRKALRGAEAVIHGRSLGFGDVVAQVTAEAVEGRLPPHDHSAARQLREDPGVVGLALQGFGQVAPDLACMDVEGRSDLDVADVVTADPGIHQAGDHGVLGGVAIVGESLHEGRRAVARADDSDLQRCGVQGFRPSVAVGTAPSMQETRKPAGAGYAWEWAQATGNRV